MHDVEFDLRLLGSAVQAAGQGIAILVPDEDAAGPRIAFVNNGFCAMYGIAPADVVGTTVVSFGIVERHQAIFTDMVHHIFNQEPFDAEVTARRKDGAEFELDLQVIPVADASAPMHWAVGLITAICCTTWKRACSAKSG